MRDLETLLRMQVEDVSLVSGETISYSPEFRVAVQQIGEGGVHIIIHADGHSSDTLDFIVSGNELKGLS